MASAALHKRWWEATRLDFRHQMLGDAENYVFLLMADLIDRSGDGAGVSIPDVFGSFEQLAGLMRRPAEELRRQVGRLVALGLLGGELDGTLSMAGALVPSARAIAARKNGRLGGRPPTKNRPVPGQGFMPMALPGGRGLEPVENPRETELGNPAETHWRNPAETQQAGPIGSGLAITTTTIEEESITYGDGGGSTGASLKPSGNPTARASETQTETQGPNLAQSLVGRLAGLCGARWKPSRGVNQIEIVADWLQRGLTPAEIEAAVRDQLASSSTQEVRSLAYFGKRLEELALQPRPQPAAAPATPAGPPDPALAGLDDVPARQAIARFWAQHPALRGAPAAELVRHREDDALRASAAGRSLSFLVQHGGGAWNWLLTHAQAAVAAAGPWPPAEARQVA